jgi:hypothetical protein
MEQPVAHEVESISGETQLRVKPPLLNEDTLLATLPEQWREIIRHAARDRRLSVHEYLLEGAKDLASRRFHAGRISSPDATLFQMQVDAVFGQVLQELPTEPRSAFDLGVTLQTIHVFVERARVELADAIRGVAIGVERFTPRAVIFISDIDVQLSRSIHDLQGRVEDELGSQFDVHVTPLQGRDVVAATPAGYRLLPS